MDSFYHEASIDNNRGEDYIDSNTVFKIMSSILEYEESLIHLNTLVSVYVKNHANESDILETNFNKPI